MTRPLTRKEWTELVHAKVATLEHRGYLLMPAQMARIAATIEAGGFAPEPVSEFDVRAWLYSDASAYDRIAEIDLRDAFRVARENEMWAAVRADARGGYVVNGGHRGHYCDNIDSVARTIAALAYAKAKGVDVSHLLGDAS